MATVFDGIDLAFRPETYWPRSPTREELLAGIKGKARRDIARRILEEEGFPGLVPFLIRGELPEEDRRYWGRIHPDLMGGEYLPGLKLNEVEIARISLKSTTSDQISIRARDTGKQIRYRVVDEYESVYRLAFTCRKAPLTLGGLVDFIEGSKHADDYYPNTGLLTGYWESQLELYSSEEAAAFASIESGFYPQLRSYYAHVARGWVRQNAKVTETEEV